MRLTRSDASAIHRTGRLVACLEQGIINDVEFVNALFDNLYGCETDHGLAQCVAVIPQRLWLPIGSRIAEIRGQTHPGQLFVYRPWTPTEEELEKLDHRVRHTVEIVAEYLRNPTGKIEYEIDDPDGMRQQWLLFMHFETLAGEKCRKADCTDDRIRYGVFCRAHHFAMIYGQPPPTTTQPNKAV